MTFPHWLTQDPDGYIHLAGHRVGLEDIIHFYEQGDSADMLHCRFPTIPLATIHQLLACYLQNQFEFDAYRAQEAKLIAKQRAAAPKGPSLEELRERRRAQRLAPGA